MINDPLWFQATHFNKMKITGQYSPPLFFQCVIVIFNMQVCFTSIIIVAFHNSFVDCT